MKTSASFFIILFLLIVNVNAQTILEEHPTVPPAYMEPGFHHLDLDDFPNEYEDNLSMYEDPYSHNLDDCIRGNYVSPNYNSSDSIPYLMLPQRKLNREKSILWCWIYMDQEEQERVQQTSQVSTGHWRKIRCVPCILVLHSLPGCLANLIPVNIWGIHTQYTGRIVPHHLTG